MYVYELLTLFVQAAGFWFSIVACSVLVTEMAVICESNALSVVHCEA